MRSGKIHVRMRDARFECPYDLACDITDMLVDNAEPASTSARRLMGILPMERATGKKPKGKWVGSTFVPEVEEIAEAMAIPEEKPKKATKKRVFRRKKKDD